MLTRFFGSEALGGDDLTNTDSITNLLKSHNVDISAVKANKILVGLGLLVDKERPSAKYAGKIKKYKALTDQGLRYGVNVENPSSPGQTTPHYFVDSFAELLGLILGGINR
ncbi:MAG: hypothetical protein OEY01_07650 [Desulfobulbaceae bacterium]|nr:hypothetical protein [Desulfobulbaceae bacterium]HIJ78928.1 hypothetical protein [Deltaproteobacteria bacterium]